MKKDAGLHFNYYIIGIALLLALALLGPYFGIHLFSKEPTLLPASTRTSPKMEIRPSNRHPQITQQSEPKTAVFKRARKEKDRPEQRDGERLSDIENLLK